MFKDVVYVHDTQHFTPTRIYTRSLVKEGVDAVKSPAFQDFLKANGYVRDEKDPNHYVNEKELFTMDVDILENNNSVVLFFNQMHVQDRDYETFKSLDLGPLELLNKADQKIAAVESYEKLQNSEETQRQISKTGKLKPSFTRRPTQRWWRAFTTSTRVVEKSLSLKICWEVSNNIV